MSDRATILARAIAADFRWGDPEGCVIITDGGAQWVRHAAGWICGHDWVGDYDDSELLSAAALDLDAPGTVGCLLAALERHDPLSRIKIARYGIWSEAGYLRAVVTGRSTGWVVEMDMGTGAPVAVDDDTPGLALAVALAKAWGIEAAPEQVRDE